MPRVGYKMMMRHRARSMSANPTSLSSLHAFCVAISAAFIGGALAYMYARRKPARRNIKLGKLSNFELFVYRH